MIYTVTFNPTIDYIISVNDIKMGNVNRSQGEYILYGGKGINVSIVLNNLGIKVKLDGVGYVSTQSVAESTQISDGMEIILTLNPRFSTEGENG